MTARRTLIAALVAIGLSALPAGASARPPEAINLYARVPSYGTYGNISPPSVGDCTVAAVADLLQTWKHVGPLNSAPFLAAYHRLVGGAGGANVGITESRVLNYWKRHGIDRYRIKSWRDLGRVSSRVALERAVSRYGALYADVAIPSTVPALGTTWTLAASPRDTPLAGLHAADVVGYNRTGPVLVTWGSIQQVTWAWWGTWLIDVVAVQRSTQPWRPNTVIPTSVRATELTYPPTTPTATAYGIAITVAGVTGPTTGTVVVDDNGQPIPGCDPLPMTTSSTGLAGTCDVSYSTDVPSQHLITVTYSGDRTHESSGIQAAIISIV